MSTRILLCDDDAGLRRELRSLLVDGGYEVVGEAADGAAALALALAERPELVISDLRMPGASGLDVAAALQGVVPVIILSAFDDPGLQQQAKALGAAFLLKGCRARTIFAAVDQAALAARHTG